MLVQVTVILEHMFLPSEMEEEATLREDLEDDIKTECTKMGPVEKVRHLPLLTPQLNLTQVHHGCMACSLQTLTTTQCQVIPGWHDMTFTASHYHVHVAQRKTAQHDAAQQS